MEQQKVPIYVSYGKDNFNYMYNMYKNFLETVPFEKLRREKSSDKDAGIVIAPRNNSGIPFCNLTIALFYLYRGHPVKIIWDDLMFLDEEIKYQNHLLGKVIDFVCQRAEIDYFKLSDAKDKEFDKEDDDQIKGLASANAIWNVRKVVPSLALDRYTEASYNVLKQNAKKINYFYSTNEFDHCVHQSLINENGGLHKIFANKYNIRVGSLDIAAGKGQMSTHDVPGYHSDLLHIVNDAIFKNDVNREIAIEDAKKEFKSRMYVKDKKGIQTVSFQNDQNKYNAEIIIPLNILWDGSALRRNRLFCTPFDWLDQTLECILSEMNSTVAVRQHPAERKYKIYGTGDDLGRYLKDKYGHDSRFSFISCYDNVNTYSLVRDSKIVLPYTSSVGLEAALMGKKVIIESDVYYSDLPIITKPETKSEYFEEIKKAANLRTVQNNPVNRPNTDAWLLYFLVNECPRIYSSFGLEPNDFKKWTSKGFISLLNEEDLAYAIEGLATDTAYAYMNCKRILKKHRKRIDRVFDLPVESEDKIRQSINEIIGLINHGNYDLAISAINNVSSQYEAIYFYPKAFAYSKFGDISKAKSILNDLVEIKPDNKRAICLQYEIKDKYNTTSISEKQKESNKMVIGILSPSYSGSTLLTAILGAHSQILGAGEIRWLIEKEYFNVERIIKNTNMLSNKKNTPWQNEAFQNVSYNNVYRTIFNVFKERCLVDSSKDIGYFKKIVEHNKGNDISIRFIFLIKHPVRLISSHLMHRWDKWEKLKNYDRNDAINFVINAVYNNLMNIYSNLSKLKKSHQIITVKYEDIVSDIQPLLTYLLGEVNLSYESGMEKYYEKEQYILGGNAGPRYHIAKVQNRIEKNIENKIQKEFYKNITGIKMDNNFMKVFSSPEINAFYDNKKINTLMKLFQYDKIE